jgi:hypothetical protein
MPRDNDPNRRPAKRGFAAMDPARQREIARKGGASVPDEKRSFSQDRDSPPLPAARAAKPPTAAAAPVRSPPTTTAPTPDANGLDGRAAGAKRAP